MKGEALVGIQEVIDNGMPAAEGESRDEPALYARLSRMQEFNELGPPDLVYVRKKWQPVVGKPTVHGYYHFVRGVDVSSVGQVSVYIRDIINSGLEHANWYSVGGLEIVGVSYRTWNAISKVDMCVDQELPGGTKESAIGADSTDVPITEDLWNEAFVCAACRHITCSGEVPMYPALRVLDGSAMFQEDHFLECARGCVARWHLAGPVLEESEPVNAASSRIAASIRDYFFRNRRFTHAIAFFESLDDLECSVHAAAAYLEMHKVDDALETVSKILEAHPNSSLALCEKAKIHIKLGELDAAAQSATAATKACPKNPKAWIMLADIYASMKQFDAAFLSLNSAIIPPPSLDPFLRTLVPNRKNLTTPRKGAAAGYDLATTLAKRQREERVMSKSNCDILLEELPGKLMLGLEREAYRVLVKIRDTLGWDELLAVRGRVFIMESDVVRATTKGNVDQLPETPNGASSSEGAGNHVSNSPAPANGIESIGNHRESLDSDSEYTTEVGGKRVCRPWLDYSVTTLYEDLRAIAHWDDEEAQAREAESAEGEENDLEAEGGSAAPLRSVEKIALSSPRPPVDWLRRGELAERLEKIEQAKIAYQVCIRLSMSREMALTATLRLMAIYAMEPNILHTLKCADAVWTYLDSVTDLPPNAAFSRVCIPVQSCISELISKCGLQAVHETLRNCTSQKMNMIRFKSVLLDSVTLQVHGFDV